MINRYDSELLKNNIALMYRNGRLRPGALLGSITAAVGRFIDEDNGELSADQVYFGLYIAPERTLERLFKERYLSRKAITEYCSAWAKGQIKGNKVPIYGRIYAPDFSVFIGFFEKRFGQDREKDRRFGRIFAEMCGDRLFSGCLYDAGKAAEQEKAVSRLMKYVSRDTVIKSEIDDCHKTYLLSLKYSSGDYEIKAKNGITAACINGRAMWLERVLKCSIHRIKNVSGQLEIMCEIGSPMFIFFGKEDISVYPVINGCRVAEVGLLPSCSSWRTFEKTASFYFFRCFAPADTFESLSFEIKIKGIEVPVECRSDGGFFSSCLNGYGFQSGEKKLFIIDGRLTAVQNRKNAPGAFDPEIVDIRINAELMKERRIWLYSDYSSVDYDNGYLQFSHDLKKQDGIERYYIVHEGRAVVFPEEERRHCVKFGSRVHKLLFLAAEKIFAAYVDAPDCLFPFPSKQFPFVSDMFRAEIIYLQHGVLHAHIPWRYSPVSRTFHCDSIVVSSSFEIGNFVNNYHFPEECLITSGMPRYDMLAVGGNMKKNKILYAPSWRAYMTDGDKELFRGMVMKLLCLPELDRLLCEKDLYLDFKPHPMLEGLFAGVYLHSRRIRIVRNADPREYIAFVTDFSSFVFDFVYLKTPVVYFFPDMDKFVHGNYQYRELDLPLEEGFGRLCLQAEEAVAELAAIAANGFRPAEPYRERMENFFLPLENCSELLYETSMGDILII